MGRLLLLFLLIGSLAACKNQSSSSKKETNLEKTNAYIHYYVRYLQAEDQLEAKATFKLGDSLHTAVPSLLAETVYFNDKTMDSVSLANGNSFYSYKDNSFYAETNNFRFTHDGVEYNHNTLMPPLDSFWVKKGSISWSDGFVVQWKGSPLKKKETVVVVLTDQHGQTLSINSLGPTENPELKILPEQIKKLATGPGEIYLVRKLSVPTPDPKPRVKGSMRTEYYSNTLKLEIKP